jgi:hypothetical protein
MIPSTCLTVETSRGVPIALQWTRSVFHVLAGTAGIAKSD